jgi:two-component sensor histidine kinase
MAITSHDLKAPVQAISGYAGLLGEQLSSGKGDPKEVLGRITGAAKRMASLIDSILDLEKISSGTLKLNVRRVDLEGILRTCVETHQALAGHRGVRIELRTPPHSRPTAGDLVKLEQLFNNLLSNAVKFSPDGGLIEVEYADRAGSSAITVSDRGPGIPEEDLQNVFDRYYQVKRPRTAAVRAFGTSVGLGLAIARSIAEMHGGRIWAENRSGGGCRFSVTLPTRLPGIPALAALLVDPEGRLTPALQGPLIRREVDCFVAQHVLEVRRFYDCERPDLVFYDRGAQSADLRALLDEVRDSPAPPLVVAVAIGATGEEVGHPAPGERLLELPIIESEIAELLRERQIGTGAV